MVCGVGLCCRGPDSKVIPASLNHFTDIDWWRCNKIDSLSLNIFNKYLLNFSYFIAQMGINPGNCTTELAKEGKIPKDFVNKLELVSKRDSFVKANNVIHFAYVDKVCYAHQTYCVVIAETFVWQRIS
jgi:hypothetical protein